MLTGIAGESESGKPAATEDAAKLRATLELLHIDASLAQKTQGLVFAERTNQPEINQALVKLLADRTEGGKIGPSVLAEPPRVAALHILVQRFPQAGIKPRRMHDYTSAEFTSFSEWWEREQAKSKAKAETESGGKPSPEAKPEAETKRPPRRKEAGTEKPSR